MTLTAIDCQAFAGGFTLGVAQAGFELAGKREMKGGFGVPSVEANRHLLPGSWHTEIGAPTDWSAPSGVAYLFGNPPCSAFSQMGKSRGAADPVSHCMTSFVEYGAALGVPIMTFESVQQAFYKGHDFMRWLHARLEDLTGARWTLHHVLDDGYELDGPARRKRYFWTASRIEFGVDYPQVERTHVLRDVIGDLEGIDAAQPHDQPYDPAARVSDWVTRQNIRRSDGMVDGHTRWWSSDQRYVEDLLARGFEWPQGTYQAQHAHEIFDRYGIDAAGYMTRRHYLNASSKTRAKSPNSEFDMKRWRYDKPCRVVAGLTGRRTLHPVEPRVMTLRELFRAQGFTDDWRLGKLVTEHSPGSVFAWPGKGIPVQAGRWVATHARNALEGTPTPNTGHGWQIGEREWVWDRDIAAVQTKNATLGSASHASATVKIDLVAPEYSHAEA